jgi:hypothetical protein
MLCGLALMVFTSLVLLVQLDPLAHLTDDFDMVASAPMWENGVQAGGMIQAHDTNQPSSLGQVFCRGTGCIVCIVWLE